MRTATKIKERDNYLLQLQKKREEQEIRQRQLLDSIATDNVELKHTIQMMKSHGNSKGIIKENMTLKKELKEKQQQCTALEQQLNKANMDLKIYSAVEQQIDKLEDLQNRLINQNASMKDTLNSIQKVLEQRQPNLPSLIKEIMDQYLNSQINLE